MLKKVVHLEDKAFMTILLSSVEAFPTKYRLAMKNSQKGALKEGEVCGLLFGQRLIKGSIEIKNVTLAMPSQIINKRSPDGVSASIEHIDRIKELANMFPMYQFLGSYHSHPWRNSKFNWQKKEVFLADVFDKRASTIPSTTDDRSSTEAAQNMKEDLLEIIIGITWQQTPSITSPEFLENNLIYNCCGNYKYSLGCYYTDLETKKLVPVDNLVCPTAAGMHHTDFGG